MKTRQLYYSLRSAHRLAKRNLLGNPDAFALCVRINSTLRDLTQHWDTGLEKPEPWHEYRKIRRGPDRDRWVLFVSNAQQRFLRETS